MPIRIPDELPAVSVLRNENVFVMTSSRAEIQAIRPLKILLLNLMPNKIETENQFLRLLSNSPLQLDIQLLRIDNRPTKNTPAEHLDTFYCNFSDIQHENFDGLLVTGAPLGKVDFQDVVYWAEIEKVIRWAREHVTSTLFSCWAVQAGLKVLFDFDKNLRSSKLAGVYNHDNLLPASLLTRGFDDTFIAPHSRHIDFLVEDIEQLPGITVYAASREAGAYLFATDDKRMVFVTGHPEYDALTLSNEYFRDRDAGLNPALPDNYFPQNNIDKVPVASWRSHGYLLFANWLNYFVYQITPYDLRVMNPTLD